MTGPANPLRALLAQDRPTFGLWCSLPHPLSVEALASCGFDWMVIDTEHTAVTLPQVMGLLQAVAPWPCMPTVRAGSLDAVEIKRLLDLGAQTLVIPNIRDADEARAAVAATRYPPEGIRGAAGLTRASRFGLIADYTATANDRIGLILQVETAAALAGVEAIAAVPGVDVLFIGPADLAASMGLPGQPGHPAVRAAVLDGLVRIAAAGVAPGVLTLDPGFARECVAAGSRFTAVGIDTELLLGAARGLAAAWRG